MATQAPAPASAAPHPLQHTWVLWEQLSGDKKGGAHSKEEWENLQKKVCSFSTVEDFFRYYKNLPPPSDVFYDGKTRKRVGAVGEERTIESFSLFKDGVDVAWEDPANIRGGEWVIRKSMKPHELNTYWENLVYGLIGQTIENGDYITGARVVDKSNAKGSGSGCIIRVELWLRTSDQALRTQLRDNMIEVMTDGMSDRASDLANDFTWRKHG